MGEVIDLSQRRERKTAAEHARALVLFECASILARQKSPAFLRLIDETFGEEEVQRRIDATVTPRRTATQHFAKRRAP